MMLITQDLLIDITKDYINRLLRQNNDIVACYLTGSVLGDQAFIGGSTDIDLVVVHKEDPPAPREIRRVKSNISLDIVHHHQSLYTFHRRMRQDSWLGYALRNHDGIIYDTDHWLEYIQAGVDAQFDSPENTHARALKFADDARRYWFALDDDDETPFSDWLDLFFKSVDNACNAVATLSGPGLTQRRFLLDFPARAEAVNQMPLVGDLARLIGNDKISVDFYNQWRPVWETRLVECSQSPHCPPNLHKARKAYFLDCCDALAQSDNLFAVLWPMTVTWRQIAQCSRVGLDEDDTTETEATTDWLSFASQIGFEPAQKNIKIRELGHFIEKVQNILEDYQREFGLL